jgi:hypothetical protein
MPGTGTSGLAIRRHYELGAVPVERTVRDELTAVTGTFQVLVDVEHDTPYLPSVISGEPSACQPRGCSFASAVCRPPCVYRSRTA